MPPSQQSTGQRVAHPQVVPNPHSLSPAAQTRFVEEPEDQTVVAGQRIVLSCVVLNYSGIVQWTKDGLALGMGQGLKGRWGEAGSGDGTAQGPSWQWGSCRSWKEEGACRFCRSPILRAPGSLCGWGS